MLFSILTPLLQSCVMSPSSIMCPMSLLCAPDDVIQGSHDTPPGGYSMYATCQNQNPCPSMSTVESSCSLCTVSLLLLIKNCSKYVNAHGHTVITISTCTLVSISDLPCRWK